MINCCFPGLKVVLFWGVLCLPQICHGLLPKEVLVIANQNLPESIGLAKYYMEKREIPHDHLFKLSLTDEETISHEEYDIRLKERLRVFLDEKDPNGQIRCLVLVYGVPLKVSPPKMTASEHVEYEMLEQKMAVLEDQGKALADKPGASPAQSIADIEKERAHIKRRQGVLKKTGQRAAVDSELALVKIENYPLFGWLSNPFFVGVKDQKPILPKENVLWVCRLDGPSPEVVKRIIDDGLAAEKTGLQGTAYFDARWTLPNGEKDVSGYALYDKAIHLAANAVKLKNTLSVVLDHEPAVFEKGRCPDAALYCGWYSLAHYVDAFDWVKGAVGYHIASSECATLRNPISKVWCKRMIEEGIAATIGPTSEPYVQAFPLPEIFFGLLMEGRLSLVECYMKALPYLSWQMVLVGDPLYRPFKINEIPRAVQ